ncbi:hypothetical protein [Streptomyces acidicola]
MVAAADPTAYPALAEVFSALPRAPRATGSPRTSSACWDGLLKHSTGPF